MENQRVRLSKAMLKSGLLTLLREKTLNHISVYELCAASQINRTTFYKYYGSPSDLLNEIERDFLAQLDEDIKSIAAQSKDALLPVLAHLYEQKTLFCLLVRSMPAQEFATHLFSLPVSPLFFRTGPRNAAFLKRRPNISAALSFKGRLPYFMIG